MFIMWKLAVDKLTDTGATGRLMAPHRFLNLKLGPAQMNQFELDRLVPGAGTTAAAPLRRQLCCGLGRASPTAILRLAQDLVLLFCSIL
ncbi:hypothetical protein XH84_00065 [Bradyrhizobium nanningense]|nr:hypothetical protein XH84_00065 [Bradyrhizobium nanningense]